MCWSLVNWRLCLRIALSWNSVLDKRKQVTAKAQHKLAWVHTWNEEDSIFTSSKKLMALAIASVLLSPSSSPQKQYPNSIFFTFVDGDKASMKPASSSSLKNLPTTWTSSRLTRGFRLRGPVSSLLCSLGSTRENFVKDEFPSLIFSIRAATWSLVTIVWVNWTFTNLVKADAKRLAGTLATWGEYLRASRTPEFSASFLSARR